MFLWNYEIEFATQILDNIFQISLHIWAVSLLFHLLRPVYHNQLIYNLSLINVHTLFMELKGQNSFHCPIYIKHVIFHSVIFLLSFRNMAINLSYLLASQIQLHVLLENKHIKLISCIQLLRSQNIPRNVEWHETSLALLTYKKQRPSQVTILWFLNSMTMAQEYHGI